MNGIFGKYGQYFSAEPGKGGSVTVPVEVGCPPGALLALWRILWASES